MLTPPIFPDATLIFLSKVSAMRSISSSFLTTMVSASFGMLITAPQMPLPSASIRHEDRSLCHVGDPESRRLVHGPVPSRHARSDHRPPFPGTLPDAELFSPPNPSNPLTLSARLPSIPIVDSIIPFMTSHIPLNICCTPFHPADQSPVKGPVTKHDNALNCFYNSSYYRSYSS